MKHQLGSDQEFVEGRGRDVAKRLLAEAEAKGYSPKQIKATSNGYIVPKGLTDARENLPHPGSQKDEELEEKVEQVDQFLVEEEFDPNDHSISEVRAYLAVADQEERQRVLSAEQEGKARKTLLPDDERNEG